MDGALPLLDPPGALRASLSLRALDSASTSSVSESLRSSCLPLCETEGLSEPALTGTGDAAAD